MKWLLSLVLVLLAAGCRVECSAIGCTDVFLVNLEPEITTLYDVTLVFDGASGAFTCEFDEAGGWVVSDAVGAAVGTSCTGAAFWPPGTPESVEITVAAQDGSWRGSLNVNPTYQTNQPNGPDCPPTCRETRLTISNDVGGTFLVCEVDEECDDGNACTEDKCIFSPCESGESCSSECVNELLAGTSPCHNGICFSGVCVALSCESLEDGAFCRPLGDGDCGFFNNHGECFQGDCVCVPNDTGRLR